MTIAGGGDLADTPEPDTPPQPEQHRPPWRRIFPVASFLLLALVGAAVLAAVSYEPSVTAGLLVDRSLAPAPGFSLPDLQAPAQTVSLAQLRGKGVVLNFWGSWCAPCRTEMPLLESAYISDRRSLRFVGIDCDDTRTAAAAFAARVHVTYELLFDPAETVASAYGLYGLPTTVFVSPDGRMLGRHIGQLDRATLRAALAEAFGG